MAGMDVLFELDDAELQGMVKRVSGAVGDMTAPMKAFGQYMITETDKRFTREEDPQGKKWKPLSQAYKLAKEQSKGGIDKILQRGKFLLTSIKPDPGKTGISIGSNMVYAAIHQLGGMAGPGRKVKIPQREYLGFNDDDVEEFKETVKDWIVLGKKS